jgi:hypothetical protein
MNKNNTRDARCVRLGFTQQQWAELAKIAKENRRAINAEIAFRIEESLPREGE